MGGNINWLVRSCPAPNSESCVAGSRAQYGKSLHYFYLLISTWIDRGCTSNRQTKQLLGRQLLGHPDGGTAEVALWPHTPGCYTSPLNLAQLPLHPDKGACEPNWSGMMGRREWHPEMFPRVADCCERSLWIETLGLLISYLLLYSASHPVGMN